MSPIWFIATHYNITESNFVVRMILFAIIWNICHVLVTLKLIELSKGKAWIETSAMENKSRRKTESMKTMTLAWLSYAVNVHCKQCTTFTYLRLKTNAIDRSCFHDLSSRSRFFHRQFREGLIFVRVSRSVSRKHSYGKKRCRNVE